MTCSFGILIASLILLLPGMLFERRCHHLLSVFNGIPIGSPQGEVEQKLTEFSSAQGQSSSGYVFGYTLYQPTIHGFHDKDRMLGFLNFDSHHRLIEKRITILHGGVTIHINEDDSVKNMGYERRSYFALSNGTPYGADIWIDPHAANITKDRLYSIRSRCFFPADPCDTAQDLIPYATLNDPE